jgi:hypothetical protein
MDENFKIPPIVKDSAQEIVPNPNITALVRSQGLPTNQQELRTIVIDSFGLQKVLLNQYLKGVNVIKSKLGQPAQQTDYNGKIGTFFEQDKPIGTSVLGTPIWDYLIIAGDTYQDRILGTVTYEEQRIDTILITLSQAHSLVLTEIQGRDDEVIEYVGKKSIRVNFKGGVYGNNNNRPKAEIANLVKILNSNKPLKIKYCGFLGEWNISEIYLMDKNIPQSMGGYNYQLFEFNAINSVPVILAAKQITP